MHDIRINGDINGIGSINNIVIILIENPAGITIDESRKDETCLQFKMKKH